MAGRAGRPRCTRVLASDDVVDDETLHPGTVVWLAETALRPTELAKFDRTVDVVAPRGLLPTRSRSADRPCLTADVLGA